MSLVYIAYEWVISIAECSPFSLFIECGFELTSNAKLIPIFFPIGAKVRSKVKCIKFNYSKC